MRPANYQTCVVDCGALDGVLHRVHEVILVPRGDLVGFVDPGVVARLEPEWADEVLVGWTSVAAGATA